MEELRLSDLRTADEDNGPRFRIRWETVFVWIVAALISYFMVEARVSVLESRREDSERYIEKQFNEMRADFREVREDVKTLLQRRP